MSDDLWTRVDEYLDAFYTPPDPALDAALRASDAAGLPHIQVSATQGKMLTLLAQMQGATNILEIGTLGGYSTIWLARALPSHGRLITLEYEAKHAEVARANIAHAGFAHQVDVRVGKAADTLPLLASEGKGSFDFVFIDADKQGYPIYFEWALKLCRTGSVIVLDNMIRQGGVIDPKSPDDRIAGVRKTHEMIAREPCVSATAIQTVGGKGYDGFVLARVISDPHPVPHSEPRSRRGSLV
jgi:predicted O-methyltransferase YrrM